MRKFLLLFGLLLNLTCFASVQDRIGSAAKDYLANRFLNAVFVFANDKKPLIIGAKGVCSLDGEQLKANEVMPIASGTKPITAAGILRLQDKMLLNVHDKISGYLDKELWEGKVPNWVHKISIHNLLTHTSGLPEYYGQIEFDLKSMSQKDVNKSIIRFISAQPMKATIGKKYEYCHTNFVILGMIIEKVSGKSLAHFFSSEFFTPLDMKATTLASFDEAYRIQKNITSSGYPVRYLVTPTGGKPKFTPAPAHSAVVPYADGGVVSTTSDLIKWYKALHGEQVISKESYQLMTTKYFLVKNQKSKKTYPNNTYVGYGILITDLPKNDVMIYHPSSTKGLRSEAGYIPRKNLYFAILSNVMVYIPEEMKKQIDLNDSANQIDIVYFRDAIINAVISKDRNISR